MDVNTALKKLSSDPVNFLRKHPIYIGTCKDGIAQFFVSEDVREEATRITARRHRTVAASPGLRFSTAFGTVEIQAYSFSVYPWDGTTFNWVDVPAPAANRPGLILTGLLTGCSVVVEDLGGGAVRVAHQKHGKGPKASELRKLVDQMPNVKAYTSGGQYDHNHNQAHVIGVAHKGAWSIFAQRQNSNFGILGVDPIL